ncbi:MAG: hypothetical protein OEU98_08700, partial [Actinomycetota bacterium]|nr:hypothetical protein [Actinomycetota bacterium]
PTSPPGGLPPGWESAQAPHGPSGSNGGQASAPDGQSHAPDGGHGAPPGGQDGSGEERSPGTDQ